MNIQSSSFQRRKKNDENAEMLKSFPPASDNHGYFFHLFDQHPNNLKDHVQISHSSITNGRDPYTLITNTHDDIFSFLTAPNQPDPQWVKFHFKKGLISLESYFLKTADHHRDDWPHLRCWKIYGSQNNIDWYLLGEEENDTLNNPLTEATFSCETNCDLFYRDILLYQSCKGFTNEYGFGLRRMDLFGRFFQLPEIRYPLTCSKLIHMKHFINLFILFYIS